MLLFLKIYFFKRKKKEKKRNNLSAHLYRDVSYKRLENIMQYDRLTLAIEY